MVSTSKFEDKVALTGVGSSTIGRRLMVDPVSLTVAACLRAVADAGVNLTDIDGLATYPGGLAGGMSEGGVTAVEEALRIQPTWISGGAEVPGPSGSAVSAMLAVAAGLCRHVLCFRTVWESTHTALARRAKSRGGGGRAAGMFEWRSPFGAMSAANWIGVNASHYFWRYGGDRASTLAPIALTARANAARNPAAIYRNPLTLDDYLSARMISSPFGLYDCDVSPPLVPRVYAGRDRGGRGDGERYGEGKVVFEGADLGAPDDGSQRQGGFEHGEVIADA